MKFAPHHVGVSVKSLEDSLQFYERFGFEVANRWRSSSGDAEVVHMSLGNYQLELFAFADCKPAPASTSELAADVATIGTKHQGVRVADADAAHRWALEQGFQPLSGVTEGRTGVRYFFLRDPSGNFFEIVQDDRAFMPAFGGHSATTTSSE